ncbi:MAG: signal peptidase I [Prevotella sp.]
MRSAVRFLISLGVAWIVLLLVRALAFTSYTIADRSLEPSLLQGDRVIVNRWSYGLRTGGDSLFQYARILPSPAKKGDLIAFYMPVGMQKSGRSENILIGRVAAVPGDTIAVYGKNFRIPKDCKTCSRSYQALYAIGPANDSCQFLVSEKDVVGRVCWVVYNFRNGILDKKRWLKRIP